MEQPGKPKTSAYTGRFAPSPTGKLHFGSLISALASFLDARSQDGRWLVRIEDIDPPREVEGSATSILHDLGHLGLDCDDQVLFQSDRLGAYQPIVERLLEEGKAFWCGCTRKDLPMTGIYPGTCKNGLGHGKTRRTVRLKVTNEPIHFVDLIQGDSKDILSQSIGDFVILRADGLPAYQLAVVVDDAFQGVTSIVRGMDLYSSTSRQIYLQEQLGFPTPRYAHHPLAIKGGGQKLGKRFGSVPVSRLANDEVIFHALDFLGQSPPRGLPAPELLSWAKDNWQLSQIPDLPEIQAPFDFQPD
jgi:glutamyl-Q tRNA(Asp) synthetase